VYRLSQGEGLAWTPAIDAHIGRRGGELLGFVLVDIDTPMAVDGTPMFNAFRWLSDRAIEAGEILDPAATVAGRTPGHPDSGHLPGWHLWFRPDPERPVRMGALARCRAVELKSRGTCPGSPGYTVVHAPGELPVLPRWLASLAGPPRVPVPVTPGGSVPGACTWKRLHGLIQTVLDSEPGARNDPLFWAACRAGEMVAAGEVDRGAAERALLAAALEAGLRGGEPEARSTIRSGLEQSGVAHAQR
jgi:hypothetical protein